MFDLNRCDWQQLAESLMNLGWAHELCKVPPEMLLPFATGIIADKCMSLVNKTWGKKSITSFHQKRSYSYEKETLTCEISHLGL